MSDSRIEGARLIELLRDAEKCARLTNWEKGFLSDIRGIVLMRGSRVTISDKRHKILERIEQKVYAT